MHNLLPKSLPEWIVAGLILGVLAAGIFICAEELMTWLRGKFKRRHGK